MTLHHPCGRLTARPGWGRDRATSLRLRDHELWLVVGGSGWMATRDERFEVGPGFCAWMRPGGVYDAGSRADDPLRFIYLHFDCSSPRRPAEFFRVDDLSFFEAAAARVVALVGRAPRSAWGEAVPDSDAAAALLRVVLAELLADRGGRDPGDPLAARLDEAAARLRTGSGMRASIASVAAWCGVTPAHFSRAFRRRFGEGPRRHQVRGRIDHARRLLTESWLGVAEIAAQLDYPDAFAFSKQFKRHVGVSPSRYRAGDRVNGDA